MPILIWVMVGIAVWHFAVLVPDRFSGGITGALLVALAGALVSGYALSSPGVPQPSDAAPGMTQALWAMPGALAALASSYWCGARRESRADDE